MASQSRIRRSGRTSILLKVVPLAAVIGTAATTAVVITGAAVITVGLPLALVGVAAAGVGQMITAMQSGTSAERRVALTQLREILNQEHAQLTPDFVAVMRPAVEQCATDVDQEVVELANEVAGLLEDAER